MMKEQLAVLRSLDARTRTIAIVGLAVLAIALVFAYAWLPAARGRTALAERVPALNAKLATMRLQAEEIKRLNTLPALAANTTRTPTTRADKSALEATFANSARATPADGNSFQVTIPAIVYTAWIDRLDQVAERFQMHATKMTIKPIADKPGQVTVDFTLTNDAAPVSATPKTAKS
jgi:type II secretory pathway component PulM